MVNSLPVDCLHVLQPELLKLNGLYLQLVLTCSKGQIFPGQIFICLELSQCESKGLLRAAVGTSECKSDCPCGASSALPRQVASQHG